MEASVHETLARARTSGNPRALALCEHALGAVRYLRGDWPRAIESLTRSIELAQSFGGVFGEVLGEQRLGQVETALGRYEEARERLERVLTIARRSNDPMVRAHSLGRILATLAGNRLEAGDLAAATRYVARGRAIREQVGECAGCDVLLYPAAVPVYIAHGDLDLAAESCRAAEEVASAFSSTAWVAGARYLQGLLDAAQQHRGAASARLREAAEMFETLGQPYEHAQALEALARVAAEEEARTLLERAESLYRDLGAAGALKRLAAPPPAGG